MSSSESSTSSSDYENSKGPVLKGTENFTVWKDRIEQIQLKKNLAGHIDGTSPKPAESLEDNANTKAIESWKSKDCHACLIVSLSCSEAIQHLIAHVKWAQEMWKYLDYWFRPRLAYKMDLFRRCINLRSTSRSPIDFCMDYQASARTLIREGITLEEILICNLIDQVKAHEGYEAWGELAEDKLYTATRGDAPKLPDLKDLCTSIYNRHHSLVYQKDGDKKDIKPLKCSFCNKPGHYEDGCFNKNPKLPGAKEHFARIKQLKKKKKLGDSKENGKRRGKKAYKANSLYSDDSSVSTSSSEIEDKPHRRQESKGKGKRSGKKVHRVMSYKARPLYSDNSSASTSSSENTSHRRQKSKKAAGRGN